MICFYIFCFVDRGEGPLAAYFASFNTPAFQLGGLRANMYLAEDRILCFELVASTRWKKREVTGRISRAALSRWASI